MKRSESAISLRAPKTPFPPPTWISYTLYSLPLLWSLWIHVRGLQKWKLLSTYCKRRLKFHPLEDLQFGKTKSEYYIFFKYGFPGFSSSTWWIFFALWCFRIVSHLNMHTYILVHTLQYAKPTVSTYIMKKKDLLLRRKNLIIFLSLSRHFCSCIFYADVFLYRQCLESTVCTYSICSLSLCSFEPRETKT